jgi:uncharacterized protein (TIGR02284 family)
VGVVCLLAHVFGNASTSYNPMEDIARTIDALTSMIAINNRRASAYQAMAEKAQRPEVKTMFHHYSDQSKRFASGLSTWRAAYGGFGVADKKPGPSPWSQVRYLLGLNFGKNMITECEELEQEAIKIYKTAISMAFMPQATVSDIEKQIGEFQRALSKLRSIRDQSAVLEGLVATR